MAIYERKTNLTACISDLKIFDARKYLTEHPFLSKRIGKDGILFEYGSEAPSPSKDYGHIQISIDQVIVRWWKITLKNIEGSIYPSEIKNSYEDFLNDEKAQREIIRICGKDTLDYCIDVIHGHIDWFKYLPLNIKTKIFSLVNLEDIPQISLVSKSFRSLARQNDLWKIFYTRQHGQQILNNTYFINLVRRKGWRQLFFTSRLKLRLELRRQKQMESSNETMHYDDELNQDQQQKQQQQQQRQEREISNLSRQNPSTSCIKQEGQLLIIDQKDIQMEN